MKICLFLPILRSPRSTLQYPHTYLQCWDRNKTYIFLIQPLYFNRRRKDKESGVARGIDFQNVSNVVNFDFPSCVDAYVHRVGRTARGDKAGTALSFVSIKEMPLLEEVEQTLAQTHRKFKEPLFQKIMPKKKSCLFPVTLP